MFLMSPLAFWCEMHPFSFQGTMKMKMSPLLFTCSILCSVIIQVQRQLQMRIEAQGKYLQKIIEEQQKLSGALKASETLPLAEDKQLASHSQPPPDGDTSSSSLRKKQKVEAASSRGDCILPSVPRKDDRDHELVTHWNVYSGDTEFGLNVGGGEFKEPEGGAG